VRLIVSARDGRVVDRFATDDRRRNNEESWAWRSPPRPPRDVGDDQYRPNPPRDQWAFGDNPAPQSRVYGNDFLFAPKAPAPTPTPDENVDAPKAKHHAVKKHHEPALAKAPASEPAPTPDANAPTPAASPSVAAVAPSTPVAPTPEPTKPAASPPAPAPSGGSAERARAVAQARRGAGEARVFA
jgi:hypothetical protein